MVGEHIGDHDPAIRDHLVYALLARGFYEELFTLEVAAHISQQLVDKNLLFLHLEAQLPATLTRSFAALVDGMLIHVDGMRESRYFGFLKAVQRDYLFDAACRYLEVESDYTGYHETYGWVHGFAHGADFLLKAVVHPDFPRDEKARVLQTIAGVFQRLPAPFIDGEERRLALVVYEGIKADTFSQKEIADWLTGLEWPLANPQDFQRKGCFESFVAAIYFHLAKEVTLQHHLETALWDYFREF